MKCIGNFVLFMRKTFLLSIFALLSITAVVSFYSFTSKSSRTTASLSQKKAAITIIWDIARKKCEKGGKGCMCGFGLCNAHAVNPGGDRSAAVMLTLINPNQLKVNFLNDISELRNNENQFDIAEDLNLPSDVLNLLGVQSLTLNAGSYPYNEIDNSVTISVQ